MYVAEEQEANSTASSESARLPAEPVDITQSTDPLQELIELNRHPVLVLKSTESTPTIRATQYTRTNAASQPLGAQPAAPERVSRQTMHVSHVQ